MQGNEESIWDNYVSLSYDQGKLEAISDKGQSVNRMLNEIDGQASFYRRREKAAREFIRRNAPRLLPVFELILKNGKNRKESIFQLLKIPRNGNALRKPTENRSRRFCGSSDVPRRSGKLAERKKKLKKFFQPIKSGVRRMSRPCFLPFEFSFLAVLPPCLTEI